MTNIPDTEQSVVVLINKTLPRRLARNPRREGYERDTSYIGTTESDIARFEATREAYLARWAEPGDAKYAQACRLLDACDHLHYCESQLSESDLESPAVAALLNAAHAVVAALLKS